MATAKLMLRRRPNSDGTHHIVLCISHKGKNTELSLKESVRKKYWDNGRVKKGSTEHENLRLINNRLSAELKKAWDAIDLLEDSGRIERLSAKEILEFIRNGGNQQSENHDFMAYFASCIPRIPHEGTRLCYRGTYRVLERYLNGEQLLFSDMSKSWLYRFMEHRTSEVRTSSVIQTMKQIKAIFNRAIDVDEVISPNLYPFRKFKLPKAKPRNLRLPIDTIREIRDMDLEQEREQLARDFFMLSFYLIGANNIDIFNLKRIEDGRIEYTRCKTKKPYSIKVEPEAMAIFERRIGKHNLLSYQDRYTNANVLGHLINKTLKAIGARVGVPNLIMYHARHSWAGIAAKKPIGAGKPMIAQALGHGATTVTDTYFDYDNELVDDLNRKVLDLLKEQ